MQTTRSIVVYTWYKS